MDARLAARVFIITRCGRAVATGRLAEAERLLQRGSHACYVTDGGFRGEGPHFLRELFIRRGGGGSAK